MGEIRAMLNATDPDLSAFQARGGKLITYFGWADTALNPLMGIDYYEQVQAKLGAAGRDVYRLFMVPGMFHCRGGVGTGALRCPDATDQLGGERHRTAAHPRHQARGRQGGATRPLCPYPQVARHLATAASTRPRASLAPRPRQGGSDLATLEPP